MLDDDLCWPENFMNIGGKTFQWVFENKEVFVEFTLSDMKSPTKMFKRWKNYCISRNKQENDKSSSELRI